MTSKKIQHLTSPFFFDVFTKQSWMSSDDKEKQKEGEGQLDILERLDEPKMYKVIILNDDYTPMEFVVLVLKKFFAKTDEQATAIMLNVHQKGSGIAGVYTLEVAEMKVMQVNQYARIHEYPLKSVMEEE